MTTISEFIDTSIKMFDLRGGDKNNPIVLHHTVNNANIFKIVVSVEEPSFSSIPVNVLWICNDTQKLNMYKKMYRRTSKNVDAVNITRNTWVEITDYEQIFTEIQIYDLDGSFLIGELSIGTQQPNASDIIIGLTKINLTAEDADNPIVIGDNDPRMIDARTPVDHTHAAQAFEQLKTLDGSIDISTGIAPVAGQVLAVENDVAIWRFLKQDDIYIPPTVLSSISITSGPNSVFETDTNIVYECTAFYDNNTSQVVTPVWTTSDPTVATISSTGIVTLQSITANSEFTVIATYTANGVTKTATRIVTVTNVNLLTSIAISGPTIINEGDTGNFTATATYDNDTSTIVTPVWSLTNIIADATVTVNASGVVTVTSTPAAFYATLNASYTQGGITKTATYQIEIIDTPVTLTSITINGADSVYEESNTAYSITAYYSNGTNVTKSIGIIWSMTVGTYASINTSTGILTGLSVDGNQIDQINASYTEEGITRTATKDVTIKNNVPTSVTISGADSLDENTSKTYTATLNYANGSTQDVSNTIVWTSTGGSFDGNTYTAPDVTADTTYTMTATYTGTVTLEGTKIVTVYNITTIPKVHYGVAPWGVDTEAEILALTQASSNASVQQYEFGITSTNYGYFAIPSTVANAENATFTQIVNGVDSDIGGWDGASWPENDIGITNGPIAVNGTNDGQPITWYVYRTDFDGLGTVTFRVNW